MNAYSSSSFNFPDSFRTRVYFHMKYNLDLFSSKRLSDFSSIQSECKHYGKIDVIHFYNVGTDK